MTRRLLAGSVCAFLAVSPVNAKQLRSTSFEPCPDLLAAATKLRDYRVRKVAINTPFDFLRTVRNMLDRLTARLPQQADQPFVDADVSNGAALIQDEFGAGVDGVGAPFKLTVVTAGGRQLSVRGRGKGTRCRIQRLLYRDSFFFGAHV